MRALIQRVHSATASDSNSQLVSIGAGLAIFLGVGKGDNKEDAKHLATQIAHIRIFDGPGGKFDRVAFP
ncbi:D-Tyr-tRNAtyr deacylase [Desulfomicrobium macestii]|uniref:D-Tyr-tRNAtyr deacylase n=1 Tax=Desulfomicrobium macestii TaxID=90731 RepID=A0ABR9H756_9BACT|nr:D-aminoacyl-tRNA deacylase [Desulfomicrobium macestii]MBE1426551.1 D-Tyr-tRNAtyr deacylase [Desulfomicrobium macestii]